MLKKENISCLRNIKHATLTAVSIGIYSAHFDMVTYNVFVYINVINNIFSMNLVLECLAHNDDRCNKSPTEVITLGNMKKSLISERTHLFGPS